MEGREWEERPRDRSRDTEEERSRRGEPEKSTFHARKVLINIDNGIMK